MESRAGGQQGCPFMMVCHAVVQRMLLESLGSAEIQAGTTSIGLPMQPAADLDMTPMFADDGFLPGRAEEVLRALRHIAPIMPNIGLRFSMLELVPAAGPLHTIDLSEFRALGCTLNETGNFRPGHPCTCFWGPLSVFVSKFSALTFHSKTPCQYTYDGRHILNTY